MACLLIFEETIPGIFQGRNIKIRPGEITDLNLIKELSIINADKILESVGVYIQGEMYLTFVDESGIYEDYYNQIELRYNANGEIIKIPLSANKLIFVKSDGERTYPLTEGESSIIKKNIRIDMIMSRK